MAACIFFVIRLHRVGQYRSRLIDRVHDMCVREINRPRTPGAINEYTSWRWKEFDLVTFDAMVWKFWRRLDSFYEKDPAREVR